MRKEKQISAFPDYNCLLKKLKKCAYEETDTVAHQHNSGAEMHQHILPDDTDTAPTRTHHTGPLALADLN